jgi:hypothetical protein
MNVHDDMSDTDVLSAARDHLSGMPLGSPPDVEAIMAAGRARRRRRLIPGVTGTLAVAAGAALAVTALTPASHQVTGQPKPQPIIKLAAWSVTEKANGNITVVVRELADLAGLQSALRADGVPANVTVLGHPDPSCRPYPMSQALFTSVYRADKTAASGDTVLIIHPSALPSGAGVQIGATVGRDAGGRGLHRADVNQAIHQAVHQPAHQVRAHNSVLRAVLVYASQQCTGG